MGWKKALLHGAIAAGAALFGSLTNALMDHLLTSYNAEVSAVIAGAALFASLGASYMAGEFSDIEPAPSPPGGGGA